MLFSLFILKTIFCVESVVLVLYLPCFIAFLSFFLSASSPVHPFLPPSSFLFSFFSFPPSLSSLPHFFLSLFLSFCFIQHEVTMFSLIIFPTVFIILLVFPFQFLKKLNIHVSMNNNCWNWVFPVWQRLLRHSKWLNYSNHRMTFYIHFTEKAESQRG